MKVWAVVDVGHDGIVDIILCKSEHIAKTLMRKLNKEVGRNQYEIEEMEVLEE